MTGMFIVSSRSRRLLLLSGPETADFGLIEGVLDGHPFFAPFCISLRVVCKMVTKWTI